MGKITTRQTGMLVFISIISMKFVLLPAIMCSYAGVDAYLSLIIFVLIDFFTLLIYLWVIKRNPSANFKDFIEQEFSKPVSKVIFALLFFYYITKAIITLKSTNNYLIDVLFDDLSLLNFLLPTLALFSFIIYKSIRCLARTAEILFVFVLLGLAFAIITSISDVNILNLFPVLGGGFTPVISPATHSAVAFGDYMIILVFMGKIDGNKISVKKIASYAITAIIIVTIFYIIFIGIFGETTINQQLAISDLSLNTASPITIGRLDWLSIIIWLISLLLQIGIALVCANICLVNLFDFKFKVTSVIFVILIITIIYLSLQSGMELMLKIILNPIFETCILCVQLGLPLLLILNGLKKRKLRNETSNRQTS